MVTGITLIGDPLSGSQAVSKEVPDAEMAHGAVLSLQLIPEFATSPPQQLDDPPGADPHPLPPHCPQLVGQHANPDADMMPSLQYGSPLVAVAVI